MVDKEFFNIYVGKNRKFFKSNYMSESMPKKQGKKIRCCKCFVTLERLKEEKICDYLIKILKEDGSEDYICRVCHEGW